MNSIQPKLPLEVLLFIVDLLCFSFLYDPEPRIQRQSRITIGSLYQTNKTFNNRLIPILFPNPKWGNCGVHLSQAGFYKQGGDHTYLAERIQSLSIHLDLPIERTGLTDNGTRKKRIKIFNEIIRKDTFPNLPRLKKVFLTSEGSTSEDLRLMLIKTISLVRNHLKILVLDFHSIMTLFNIHTLELRYEMEVSEEKIWPEGLQELTFLIGSRSSNLTKEFWSKVVTFAFQILGGMDIIDILDSPDAEEIEHNEEDENFLSSLTSNGKESEKEDRNLQVQQKKQKGVFRIDYGDIFYQSTAQMLKGIMSSKCFRFDPKAEELSYEKRKGLQNIFPQNFKTKTPRFILNLKGGMKVEHQKTFDARAWLLQSKEIVLEGGLKGRDRLEFANQKFFEADHTPLDL